MTIKQMSIDELQQAKHEAEIALIYAELPDMTIEQLQQLLQVVEEHIASREESGPGGPVYNDGAIT